jgi:hypothetical protein
MPFRSVGDLALDAYSKALRNIALLAMKSVDNRSRRNARQATTTSPRHARNARPSPLI